MWTCKEVKDKGKSTDKTIDGQSAPADKWCRQMVSWSIV